jgi:hypothetical protein
MTTAAAMIAAEPYLKGHFLYMHLPPQEDKTSAN